MRIAGDFDLAAPHPIPLPASGARGTECASPVTSTSLPLTPSLSPQAGRGGMAGEGWGEGGLTP
jgi:hypothetical protein